MLSQNLKFHKSDHRSRLKKFRYVYNICKYEDARYLVSIVDICNNLRLSIHIRNLSFSYYLCVGGLYPVRPLAAARSEGPGSVSVPEDLQPIMVVE